MKGVKRKDLKPCPFCGNKDIDGFWTDKIEYEVGCSLCYVRIQGRNISEAEKAWNTRVKEITP